MQIKILLMEFCCQYSALFTDYPHNVTKMKIGLHSLLMLWHINISEILSQQHGKIALVRLIYFMFYVLYKRNRRSTSMVVLNPTHLSLHNVHLTELIYNVTLPMCHTAAKHKGWV